MMERRGLSFLYNNAFGRCLLWIMKRRFVSRAAGAYLSSPLSAGMIKGFIRKNGIDMSDYEDRKFSSFNDFFTRRIKPGKRPVSDGDGAFVCPCDGLLSAYEISGDSVFFIKGSPYSVCSMLGEDEAYKDFTGGYCLVFRLCVDNYHRYCYFDSGRELSHSFIPGVLHTVDPIALGKYQVYKTNCREYTLLDTAHFGKAAYVEVGAMLVGRIKNTHRDTFDAGDEKGYFEFGGSTVVILIKKGARPVDERYFRSASRGDETAVRYGQRLN